MPRQSATVNSTSRVAWIEGVNINKRELSLFGVSGREMAKPVVGFYVRSERERLVRIRNITPATLNETMTYHTTIGDYIFLLMDDEVVKQVSYSVASSEMTAIRFVTNMRVSQWFGQLRGKVKTFAAPSGCAIHSLCGENKRFGGFASVGFVIWRLEMPIKELVEGVRDVMLLKGSPPEESVLHSVAVDLSAVLIQYSYDTIQAIEALSTSEHGRLVELQGHVSLPKNEHLVQILPDEKIIGVEFGHGSTLDAICFETTRRKTQWFCSNPNNHHAPKPDRTYRTRQDEFICGFFASRVDSISFGVVVMGLPKDA